MLAVIPLRPRLSATAVVAAMLVTIAVPLVANASAHRVCLAKQHDCGTTARLKARCCLESGDPSGATTPAAVKTRIAQPVADATTVVDSAPPTLPGVIGRTRTPTAPQRSSPPDLITLFGTFLI